MKIKYLYFVLIVFSLLLSVGVLFSKEIPLKVITSPKVYSMKHTELNETFKISVLMNRNDTYHLNPEYIHKSVIKDGDEYVPVKIEIIEVSSDQTTVSDESYYLVNFVTSLQIESNDHSIEYDNASLEITYENDMTLDIYIGELNYLFKENTNDLSLYTLQGTFGEVNNVNTVTGVAIELMNQSDYNLLIKRVDIYSNDVSFNNDYFIEKNRKIDMFEDVSDVLLTNSYDFTSYESKEQHYSILEGQMKRFYIPLLYNDEIKYISRFVIIVTYEINGIEQAYYIDDFIFMDRINFGPEFEQGYQVYVYED